MFDFSLLLADAGAGYAVLGATIGAGLATLGVALGLGKIASGFAEGVARQPEASGKIQGPSLLMAFLAEGVALFACVICFLASSAASATFAAPAEGGDGHTQAPAIEQPAEQVANPAANRIEDGSN